MEHLCKEHKIEFQIHCNELDTNHSSDCVKENKYFKEKSHMHTPIKQYLVELAFQKETFTEKEESSKSFKEKTKQRENFKGNNQSLVKIGTVVQQKTSKAGFISKNIFRNSQISLAFERKNLDSPFLFYYNPGYIRNFHLCNLVFNTSQTYILCDQTSYCDIEQHNGKIYFCGGYIRSFLSTCCSLDLSNYRKAQGVRINDLNDARGYSSLISTPANLYIIGGCNCNGYLNSCEMLEISGNWMRIANLNTSSMYITLAYVHPSYIYCLGSASHPIYEKLNLETVNNANWEVLQIQRATKRGNGCTIQMKECKILLIGGYGVDEFSVLNLKAMTITKKRKPFHSYFYNGYKLRQFCGYLHIVSKTGGNRILITSIERLEYWESGINF